MSSLPASRARRLVPAAKAITVRDLLLHTSGLNARTSEIYRREQVRTRTMTMAQFIANLVRVPLMEDPGTRYRYSEGTSVLGRLVEIWSGKPFEVFLEERIFRPLRMTDTMFWAATPETRARLTTAYGPAPAGGLTQVETETLPFTERPGLIEGAVGLLSTVPDYVRFAQMLLNKGELDGVRLLSAKTVETMTTNGLSEAVQKTRGASMGWGLANVQVLLSPAADDPASVGEYGWDGTAGTIFWVDPGKEMVTVLMTQSVPSIPIRFVSGSRLSCRARRRRSPSQSDPQPMSTRLAGSGTMSRSGWACSPCKPGPRTHRLYRRLFRVSTSDRTQRATRHPRMPPRRQVR